MRTSRISRETAHLAQALASTTPSSTSLRRSLRGFQHQDSSANASTRRPSSSASELSTPPSSPQSDASSYETATSTGKRKRNAPSSAKAKTPAPRRTPRKAPKREEQEDSEPKVKKGRRQPAKRITGKNGNVEVEPPANWEKMYTTTAEMRKRVVAPVDTMGCESLADLQRSAKDQRLQTLIALMLSSQTKDTVTAVAMRNLQENLPGGFNLEGLLAVEPEKLNELIWQVGFHNNKTKYIKQVAPVLRDKFNGDIPDTIEGLVSLNGVGPKMAYLTMSAAWGRDEGIGVDVHVHRITNLWGWHKTANPEQTRAELEAWLPKDKWHDINHLLVGFGQTICLPVGRKCGECDLAGMGLCPSAVRTSPVKKKVKKMEVEIDDGGVKEEEEVKVERDDVGIKVEADLDGGNVELQSIVGAQLPGVEGEDFK